MSDPNSLFMMCTMALILGLRHGFDLDHLATIDAMTRMVGKEKLLSKLVGFLFSVGHGMVVILMSLILGTGLLQAHIPHWLDGVGTWISIFFLLLFGIVNLFNVLSNKDDLFLPGFQRYFMKWLNQKPLSPLLIMSVGALFALSFDTMSQVALFSLSASLISGWWLSVLLGLFFLCGMLLSDGVNGLLVSFLLQKAKETSIVLSRCLGFAVSFFSLGLALASILKSI